MKYSLIEKDWNAILSTLKSGNKEGILEGILRLFYRWRPPDGVKVVEKDWEVLVVLDACRYDVFAEHNTIEGELEKKVSRGSTSIEWLNRNFTDYYDDIVYVTANPHASDHNPGAHYRREDFVGSNHFHDVIEVYLEDETQEHGTTHPEALTDVALDTLQQYPNKRIIVHYMQPHGPYIGDGDTGESLGELLFEQGHEAVWSAYVRNLKRVLSAAQRLIKNSSRDVVVTADHGELFGKYGLHSHPHSIYVDELVEVPWLKVDAESEQTEIASIDF